MRLHHFTLREPLEISFGNHTFGYDAQSSLAQFQDEQSRPATLARLARDYHMCGTLNKDFSWRRGRFRETYPEPCV